MKLKISRTLKLFLTIVNAVLIVAAAVYLYLYYTTPHIIEVKEPIYNYVNVGDVHYQVLLLPNVLYEENSLSEGNIYITEFVDYIKASFEYSFDGDKTVDIKGDYEIVAVVEGYTSERDSAKTIWKKVFSIYPKTSFEAQDKSISINREIPIKLGEYKDFAQKVSETSKVNTSVKLTVQMNVNIRAVFDNKPVEEKISPAIEIPLNTNYFTIAKINTGNQTGKIEETRKIQLPIDNNVVILCIFVIVVLVISLLYLIFFTTEPTIEDLYLKKFNKVFKNYGSRLVALNNETVATNQQYCKVRSIDDLVRVADELGKPLLYEYNPNPFDITTFYVFDDAWVYVLDLKNSVPELTDHKAKDQSIDSEEEEEKPYSPSNTLAVKLDEAE